MEPAVLTFPQFEPSQANAVSHPSSTFLAREDQAVLSLCSGEHEFPWLCSSKQTLSSSIPVCFPLTLCTEGPDAGFLHPKAVPMAGIMQTSSAMQCFGASVQLSLGEG